MAESTTSTSLYQHWLTAKEAGQQTMDYTGHRLDVTALEPTGALQHLPRDGHDPRRSPSDP